MYKANHYEQLIDTEKECQREYDLVWEQIKENYKRYLLLRKLHSVHCMGEEEATRLEDDCASEGMETLRQ